METAFLLQHESHDTEDVKIIGIYATRASASAAILRLRDQSGFRDHPSGFSIDEYPIDRDHWIEGFVTL
jgi:homoserine kinase type II